MLVNKLGHSCTSNCFFGKHSSLAECQCLRASRTCVSPEAMHWRPPTPSGQWSWSGNWASSPDVPGLFPAGTECIGLSWKVVLKKLTYWTVAWLIKYVSHVSAQQVLNILNVGCKSRKQKRYHKVVYAQAEEVKHFQLYDKIGWKCLIRI